MTHRALCIGINDYGDPEHNLSGCVNDAKDWSAALSRHGFTATTLFDKAATRSRIRSEIRTLMNEAADGDYLAIHFSGHGSYVPDQDGDEPDGYDECICPCDVTSSGAITDDDLFDMYSLRPAGAKLIVFSDSCHSGTVARLAPASRLPAAQRGKAARRPLVRFLPPSVFLKKKDLAALGRSRALRRSNPPGRRAGLLMAGCQDHEYSYDGWFNGRANGVFSYVAIWALKKLSGSATYRQWHDAIRRVLPTTQYPQTPNLFGSASLKDTRIFV
jgi:hypothetical protein